MVRKIKPQRAQRITESCYFYLSPPLCHSVSSVVFRNFISKISKVFGVLVTATRDTKDLKFPESRILEKGLNESCHDQWRELCEVLGFMRKPCPPRQRGHRMV